MAKVSVDELARELGVGPDTLLAAARQMGGREPYSVEEPLADRLREHFRTASQTEPVPHSESEQAENCSPRAVAKVSVYELARELGVDSSAVWSAAVYQMGSKHGIHFVEKQLADPLRTHFRAASQTERAVVNALSNQFARELGEDRNAVMAKIEIFRGLNVNPTADRVREHFRRHHADELARELGVDCDAVMAKLYQIGVDSAAGRIDEPTADRVREHFRRHRDDEPTADRVTEDYRRRQVDQLARELGVDGNVVMAKLYQMGISSAGGIDEPTAHRLRQYFRIARNTEKTRSTAATRRQPTAKQGAAIGDRRRSLPSGTSRRPPAVSALGKDGYVPDPADVVQLQTSWTEAVGHDPDYDINDSAKTVRFLVQRTGMNRSAIFALRDVRNKCSHARASQGWPSRYEFDMALATARELLRRLSSSQ